MSIYLTCTKPNVQNKVGNLPVDKNGYRKMILGALDTCNESGLYYAGGPAIENLIKSSFTRLAQRAEKGVLQGELGHPKQKPGMTLDQYVNVIRDIDIDRVCVHFRDIEFKEAKDTNGNKYTQVIGSVKPTGSKGAILKEQLENPDQNVAFSLRCLRNTFLQNGKLVTYISEFFTYDNVIEPGINVATKYDSPGLESFSEVEITSELFNKLETNEKRVADKVGLESGLRLSLDSMNPNSTMMKNDDGIWQKVEIIKPVSLFDY